MSHAKNKLDWCLKKAQKELQEGKKHRGLEVVRTNTAKAREHIAKAEHNLKVTLYLHQGGYTDWCSSSLFYTLYHCFLAILAKFGYESRNQECTFAVIRSLIEEKKIALEQKDIDHIDLLDVSEARESITATHLREEYQYGTKVLLQNHEYQLFLQLAKKILDKTKEIIEE